MTRVDTQTERAATLTASTTIEVLQHLCRAPERSVSAAGLARQIDRGIAATTRSLEALVERRLAVRDTDSGVDLYRLAPARLVWRLAEAHRGLAA